MTTRSWAGAQSVSQAKPLAPMLREFCGEPTDPTPEALAPGGNHPSCRYPRALLASGGRAPSPERLAMARWMARIAFARDDRRRARAGGAR